MNKRGHVVNAVLLSVGLAVLLDAGPGAVGGWGSGRPETASVVPTLGTVLAVGVPVTLGALFPDVDTAFGTHRQTFHNLPTLALFGAFPLLFGNLQYVWLGVLTHYVLDLCGNVRGMALFYPWPEEYDVPVGVNVDSPWADVVTLAVTGAELAVVWAVLETGVHAVVLDAVRSLV